MDSKAVAEGGMDSNPMDELEVVANSLATANKALRGVIRMKDDEIDRLERFEKQFSSVKENFTQFKELAINHDKKAEELQVRLHFELNKQRQTEEDLKNQIDILKSEILKQKAENERLEFELKESVERLHKLKYSNADHSNAYANSFPIILSPNSFIQRLCDDPE